jgi:hypothetical protein
LWTASRANGSLSLSANGGASTYIGLHHLHAKEMGGRTANWADRLGPSLLGSVAPSLPWVLFGIFQFPPSITWFWWCHPHVQDRGSSRMKSCLLCFNPRGCSVVTLWSLPPFEVISSCSRIWTWLIICSFELVVTSSF